MLDFGLSKTSFKELYYEKQPYLKRGALASIGICWEDVNQAIYVGEAANLGHAGVKLHKGQGFIPEEQYIVKCLDQGLPKKKIIKEALYEHLNDGGSIIFNRMESVSKPIRDISNQVARFVGEDTVANGYVAFGEKESFGNHWDTHDVFAVQLIGRKRWKIFSPTYQLPLPYQTSGAHKADCPREPIFDEILEAGDILYIPRGWWHTAVPLNEETFHVAVGIHGASVVDYVKWMTEAVLPHLLECREMLAFTGNDFSKLQSAGPAILAAILDPKHYEIFQGIRVANERTATGFDLERFALKKKDEKFNKALITFNSKVTHADALNQLQVNGVKNVFDSEARELIQRIGEVPRPVQYEELQGQLNKTTPQQIKALLLRLSSQDVIEIHPSAN